MQRVGERGCRESCLSEEKKIRTREKREERREKKSKAEDSVQNRNSYI